MSPPLTIKTNQDYIFIGLDDNEGCYIKLLDTDNTNDSNFTIAPGYNIQDIQLFDDYIALSAGYGGSLVYNKNDSGMISNDDLFFLFGGIYAY